MPAASQLSSDHPTERALADYVDGKLSRADAEHIGQHLQQCATCAAMAKAKSTDEATVGAPEVTAAFSPVAAKPGAEQSNLPVGSQATEAIPVAKIGRYVLRQKLGQGGFGTVYLAYDSELQREVALKTPRIDRTHAPEDLERFLNEARIAASLRHDGIVAVYDVLHDGTTVGVAQEYVAGSDLGQWLMIHGASASDVQLATMLADIAEAVAFAHQHGLVHRDLKPANILLDGTGRPRVADFGLALHDRGRRQAIGEQTGTPPYMSPEQIRGESHRLDGRSDIWSLGVILYEMLAGRRPFQGKSRDDVFAEILELEPRPPRQFNPQRSPELERICLKCLSKRIGDRYGTAADLASDLKAWKVAETKSKPATAVASIHAVASQAGEPHLAVPKGLRSFDADDASCFLDLLPGPRGRDGLPEGIRFWKLRIERASSEQNFSVGLLYGPSGCGKSSLVRAGLLPLLAPHVVAVYVEATAHDTEARLLRALHKHVPQLPTDLDLTAILTAVREGRYLPAGKKLLIVLDQFEQWLHARGNRFEGELTDALRQCEPNRLQTLVMVRDDFWLATSRFMHELEVDLVQGQNLALVDLFAVSHARQVLTTFGQALGRLPLPPGEPSAAQQQFISAVVAGLATEGKVVPVRLSLLAELIKNQSWDEATLERLGGIRGLGVHFLEETFSARTANPRHRAQQNAARGALQALLPEVGTNIKGQMRSRQELQDAAGLDGRDEELADLMRILDSELRLITPTEAEATPQREGTGQFYQLTHDYLVPSLREWLTLKQRETMRGRAELQLADRTAIWSAKPVQQHLPSLLEFLQLRLLTQAARYTDKQQQMMAQASRFHALRGGFLGLAIVLLLVIGNGLWRSVVHEREQLRQAGVQKESQATAAGLVSGLLNAEIEQVPGIVTQLSPVREWADPLLRRELSTAPDNSVRKLHAALALLPVDESQGEFLRERLLTATPAQFQVILSALRSGTKSHVEPLWRAVANSDQPSKSRLQAACALAQFTPEDARWTKNRELLVNWLASEGPLSVGPWITALQPVGGHLFPVVQRRFAQSRDVAERFVFATALAQFGADRPDEIVTAVRVAEMREVPILAKALPPNSKAAEEKLVKVLNETDPALASMMLDNGVDATAAREILDRDAQRQARAAVALWHLGHTDYLWNALRQQPNPRLRTFLIHQVRQADVGLDTLSRELEKPHPAAVIQGILLALGEFNPDSLSDGQRNELRKRLSELLAHDDPGVHSGCEWLCTHWSWPKPEGSSSLGERRWEAAPEGHTLAHIAGPVQFDMGIPYAVHFPEHRETQHPRWIGRSFAVATTETTRGQFQRFLAAQGIAKHESLETGFATLNDGPVAMVSWYEAAWYCNWLSEQAGLPRDQWCYEPNADGKYAPGMKHAADYLERTGYRLPTEAEWEYGCGAGTSGVGGQNLFHFGSDVSLLPQYGWYAFNSPHHTQPAGQLRPNALGLFDMHGNVVEWCSDGPSVYPFFPLETVLDLPDEPETVTDLHQRAVRGGQFPRDAQHLYTTHRRSHGASAKYGGDGFRIARTIPTLQPIVLDVGQQVRQQAILQISAESAPFEIVEITGGIELEPRRGQGTTQITIAGTGLAPRHFTFRVRRRDTRQMIIVHGKLESGKVQLHAYSLNQLEMKLAHIPAGEFQMGSTPDEIKQFLSSKAPDDEIGRLRIDAEGPQHRVQITKPFRLGATEVTNEQFQRFVDSTQYKTQAESDSRPSIHLIDGNWRHMTGGEYSWKKPGYPSDLHHPVVNVTWNDAQAFCKWLSAVEGEEYTLPTEAQWEYAARAGTTMPYYTGVVDIPFEQSVWFNLNWQKVAHPVNRREPNPWGLFDMYGNVEEWCQDLFNHHYYEKSPAQDPPGSQDNTDGRAIRGGNAFLAPAALRSAARYGDDPNNRGNFLGFRVASVDKPLAIKVEVVRSQVIAASAAEHRAFGKGERLRIENVRGDVQVEPTEFTSPASIQVTAVDRSTRTYSFDVVNAETATRRNVRGVLLFPQWKLRFYQWEPNPANVLDPPQDWAKVTGSPVLAELDSDALFFHWAHLAPLPNVPGDYFAVTADCELELPEGELEIRVQADDNVQIYIDDAPIMPRRIYTLNHRFPITAGKHRFHVNFAESNIFALLQVSLRMYAK